MLFLYSELHNMVYQKCSPWRKIFSHQAKDVHIFSKQGKYSHSNRKILTRLKKFSRQSKSCHDDKKQKNISRKKSKTIVTHKIIYTILLVCENKFTLLIQTLLITLKLILI